MSCTAPFQAAVPSERGVECANTSAHIVLRTLFCIQEHILSVLNSNAEEVEEEERITSAVGVIAQMASPWNQGSRGSPRFLGIKRLPLIQALSTVLPRAFNYGIPFTLHIRYTARAITSTPGGPAPLFVYHTICWAELVPARPLLISRTDFRATAP